MTRLLPFAALIALLLLGSASAQQTPSEGFGLGATVGCLNSETDILGGHVSLIPSANLHVGAQVGFAMESGDAVGASRSYWLFAPYAKFLLSLRNDFSPFLIGQIVLDNGGSSYTYTPGGTGETSSSMRSSLFIGGGAEYFPSSQLGVYAYLGVLDLGLSPQSTRLGLLEPRVGVEWFFR